MLKRNHVVACALALGVGLVSTPSAAFDITFPADTACNFTLGVDVLGGANTQYREFYDKDGNIIRTLSAGKGPALVFTNVDTDATFATRSNGSVAHTTLNADGSSTEVTTGHFIIIFFPTDVPAGPSTKLYIGRVVFTIDPAGNYTLQSVSGNSTDICAALTP